MIKEVNIFMERSISSDDYYNLTILYLPLLSNDAYSLYLLLAHLVDKEALYARVSSDDLVKYLKLDYLKIQSLREELEALALVNTYKKDDSLLIRVNHPLDANMFIKTSGLGAYLADYLGENSFKQFTSRFRIKNVNDALNNHYEEITKSFTDKFKTVSSLTYYKDYFRNENVYSEVVYNHSFDFELFLDCLPPVFKLKAKTVLEDEKFQNEVKRLGFMYHLNEADLANAFIKAYDVNGFKLELFTKRVKEVYNEKCDVSNVNLIQVDATKKEDQAYLVDFKTFHDNFSGSISSDVFLSKLEAIRKRTGLSLSVMNFTYEYLTKKNDGRFITLEYYENVLKNLKYKNLTSSKEIKDFIDQNYFKETVRKEKAPDWAINYKIEETTVEDFNEVYKLGGKNDK